MQILLHHLLILKASSRHMRRAVLDRYQVEILLSAKHRELHPKMALSRTMVSSVSSPAAL